MKKKTKKEKKQVVEIHIYVHQQQITYPQPNPLNPPWIVTSNTNCPMQGRMCQCGEGDCIHTRVV